MLTPDFMGQTGQNEGHLGSQVGQKPSVIYCLRGVISILSINSVVQRQGTTSFMKALLLLAFKSLIAMEFDNLFASLGCGLDMGLRRGVPGCQTEPMCADCWPPQIRVTAQIIPNIFCKFLFGEEIFKHLLQQSLHVLHRETFLF